MFSQKKRNYTWIFVCIALVIAIISVIIMISALVGGSDDDAAVNAPTPATDVTAPNDEDVTADTPADQTEDDDNTPTEKFYESYYLVKRDNNVIKIYFSDETGKLTELETTSIVYETLASADQMRFDDGIRVKTRDDLNRIIMDYES